MRVLLTYLERVKRLKIWRRPRRRTLWLSALGIAMLFSAYLVVLYQQLNLAFQRREEFSPTRIYSDVVRLRLGQTKSSVEARLRDLNYSITSEGNKISFTLRQVAYPDYLLPDGHPTFMWQSKRVEMEFESDQPQAPLVAIGPGLQDIYLEPELVTTLARSGPSGENGKDQIRYALKFENIPAPVWQAIIAIEDQHFLDHKGLDPRGFARAIWINLKTLSFAQGGSTLTQQLVKNLMARRTKNLFKKINELFLALILEVRYDKEQILERYLNEVYLGQVGPYEIHGVGEGAKHFFGKSVQDLNLAETAMLAGLIRGPGFYSPYRHMDRAVGRQKLVLQKMVETEQIAPEEMEEALLQPIRLVPPTVALNRAPYFTDYVKAELTRQLKDKMSESEISDAGFRVYTTLDLRANAHAQKAVTEGLHQLERRLNIPVVSFSGLEGALAAVEHGSGYIRALVGGRDYVRSNFNRILNMKRQVGSTFKPLVYLTALTKGWRPGTPVMDAPWKLIYDGEKQKWEPKNYDPDFRGWTTLYDALIYSINTVAARLGTEVGLAEVASLAKKMGIDSDLLPVPALSLGATDLSPVELLKVYSVLANDGQIDDLTVIRAITQEDGTGFARFVYHPTQVIDAGIAAWMTAWLQGVFREGTAKSAEAWGFPRGAHQSVAGKTGTTSHHRDAWFAGYSPQWTSVVWVGLDQGSAVDEKGVAKFRLTGAGSALPVWADFMRRVHEGEIASDFSMSHTRYKDIVEVDIDRKSGKIATPGCMGDQVVRRPYLRGFEPESSDCAADYSPWENESKRPDIR